MSKKSWLIVVVCLIAAAPVIAADLTVRVGDTVTFTGGCSNTCTYSWVFGDGGTSTAQNPSHQYTVAGLYTAVVTATDQYSQVNTCQKTVQVNANQNPTIDSFTADPTTIPVGATLNITGTTSDLDGDTVSWALTVDPSSTVPAANVVWIGPTTGTGDINSVIQPNSDGTLVIRVTADDGHGGSATTTVTTIITF